MKIELNSRTLSIKETYLKKEAGKDLTSEKLSLYSMAIAQEIYDLAKSDEWEQKKLLETVSKMIQAFLNGDKLNDKG